MMGTEEALRVNSKEPTQERRSFLCKMGAALSAVVAAGVPGVAQLRSDEQGSLKEQVERLSRQLGTVEDTKAIHKLHQTYGHYLDKGIYEEIVNLFSEDAQAYFNGGIFVGRDKGIRRLYVDRFGRGPTVKNDGPVHGVLLDRIRHQDAVEFTPDGKFAQARFHCLMQVSARDTTKYPMMDLARQQGQGILQWWEDGLYENTYVKDGDIWKIETLSYLPQAQTGEVLGWSQSRPDYLPPFSKTYPADPAGPDKLIVESSGMRNGAGVKKFHSRYPAFGEMRNS